MVQQVQPYRKWRLKEQQEEPCRARVLKEQPCKEMVSMEQPRTELKSKEQSCKVKGLNKVPKHFDMRKSKTELLTGNSMENQTACHNFQLMSTAG